MYPRSLRVCCWPGTWTHSLRICLTNINLEVHSYKYFRKRGTSFLAGLQWKSFLITMLWLVIKLTKSFLFIIAFFFYLDLFFISKWTLNSKKMLQRSISRLFLRVLESYPIWILILSLLGIHVLNITIYNRVGTKHPSQKTAKRTWITHLIVIDELNLVLKISRHF